MVRLCVVCTGNICRSPMAESILRRRIAEAGLAARVTVESAGTQAWHIDEPADPRAVAALDRYGYDARGHRARHFDRAWFPDLDLILTSDEENDRRLRQLAPDVVDRRKIRLLRSFDPAAVAAADTDIPDPYYGDDAAFQLVREMIERAAPGLLDAIRLHLADERIVPGGEPSRH